NNTGKGRFLDISMLEVAASVMGFNMIGYSVTGKVSRPMGTAHPLLAPYQAYATQTQPVTVGILTEQHWKIFCDLISRADLVDDARFATAQRRVDNRDQLNAILEPIFESKPAAY